MFRLTAIAIICALSLAVTPALAGEQFVGEVLKVDTAASKLTVKKRDGMPRRPSREAARP